MITNLTEHSPECIATTVELLQDYLKFISTFPGYCRECQDMVGYKYDSQRGLHIPCNCVTNNTCPLCGTFVWDCAFNDEEVFFHCPVCNFDISKCRETYQSSFESSCICMSSRYELVNKRNEPVWIKESRYITDDKRHWTYLKPGMVTAWTTNGSNKVYNKDLKPY